MMFDFIYYLFCQYCILTYTFDMFNKITYRSRRRSLVSCGDTTNGKAMIP